MIGLIGLVSLISTLFVSAQSLRPALQDLNQTFNLLIAAKKSALTGPDKEKVEVSLRQSTFNDVIDVSLAEIENLKNKLWDLADTDKYLETLAELEKFYKDLRSQINQELALEDLIKLAREFKIWREAVYQPKVDEIAGFILAIYNQRIIVLAASRLERIKADLEKVEEAIPASKWSRLTKLLERAEESLEAAKKLDVKEPAFVIEKIKEVYSYFLEMSKLVKK